MIQRKRMPEWLKKRIPLSRGMIQTRELLARLNLNTVCESALCPNIGECFSLRRATFMILGDHCTRNCRFCAVHHGAPLPVEEDEPRRIGEAVRELELSHVVITSVTRDDLEDGGASHFARVIREVREVAPHATIEVLTPDFRGDEAAIREVVLAGPHVFNHNIETVPRLYAQVRPGADYERSLALLRLVKEVAPEIYSKSGLMVGLGEERDEVYETMEDLRGAGCDILTIGQYLQPSLEKLPVVEFVTPDTFEEYRRKGESMGFISVASAPFVRSSFHAGEVFREGLKREDRGKRGSEGDG